MKPYLYILAVLMVGAGIGYFIGQKSVTFQNSVFKTLTSDQDDSQLIRKVLEGQSEAYKLHDALLLFKDCSNSYVEIVEDTGESRGLERSLIYYHQMFVLGHSINFNFKINDLKIAKNSAVVKASYSKTSDLYDQEGIKGLTGEGLWLLSKSNGRWQINAFSWTEEAKK
ncbi:MAG: hypothetical protein DMG05_09370 [Acidobacteria bacterium]|jgi:hypothetical protein|nr:MAG: hypothetical protein DMG05_09370 [Acidobacteriota bacterium]